MLSVRPGGSLRHLLFICRIGHTFSISDLLAGKEEQIEARLCFRASPTPLACFTTAPTARAPRSRGSAPPWKTSAPSSSDTRSAEFGPRDQHLVINDGHLQLRRGAKEHRTRPAIDPLFRSAAHTYGPRAVGVLLSGSGDDGVTGLIEIKKAGGVSLVQHPSEALHPSMPRTAIEEDDVDRILVLHELAAALTALAEGDVFESQASRSSDCVLT